MEEEEEGEQAILPKLGQAVCEVACCCLVAGVM